MRAAPASRRRRAGRLTLLPGAPRFLALLAVGLLLAGCAAADKNQSSGAGQASASSSGMSGMAGMNMSSSASSQAPEVDGVKPVPTQTLATGDWQGMEIEAQTRTPVRFVVFNGVREQMIDPPSHSSFHLMIMLSDAHTGEPIPYASSVWATITNSRGKIIFDDVQWPMISRYMGPHYGNDVPELASGRYKLNVLVGPPTFARAAEYRNVWLTPHNLTSYFVWNARTGIATVSTGHSASSAAMSGMGGMSVQTNVPVNGYRATSSTLIANAYWQGMRIQTRRAAPTPFYVFDGSSVRRVAPAPGSSFYLMAMLADRDTGEAVTYAPVQATVRDAAGAVVYHGELEPTTSAFDGPYYGNNVKLPGDGRYTLELRIDPPRQARHLEYEHVWLSPHTLVEHFTWQPAARA